MPYRLLVTNIPLRVGEEEFYDYVRAHVGGEAVVNALLIMRPDGTGTSPHMSSSGAALVDYSAKSAADAARRVDFYVDGAAVMMKAVGSVPAPGRHAETLAAEGREAYQRLRCGVAHADRRGGRGGDAVAGQKRRRGGDSAVASDSPDRDATATSVDGGAEVELRLVGVPRDLYGARTDEGPADAGGRPTGPPAFDLFADVARSVRRATLGELLSLRRLTDEEALIRVSADTAAALLERAEDGLQLLPEPTAAAQQAKEAAKGPCDHRRLYVRPSRPRVQITGDNFALATKHEVVGAMARIMALTNAKVAGFIDPFGNFLLPSVN
ncbi:uncharacterized protein Tco025E_06954 [Trypanosoma conorhini]|uniref:RRM domain-containing protein n=1 Tax=Trypanosoma conorhini TaxID=83891 RepID=A0A422NVX5_9TRYP|nr:uncharacterized protein Tco025E_06954 [Trypanosoma conorhini]RNF09623.1 hypothetical protein Tco025E_06954 [Trypanosoma conorhini]